jgi:DNA end-binding protein Ku
MAARANWKGVLRAGEVSCPVALYTAASTAERIAFHILNRKTGHRVHREFVDAETGERVEAKEQVKGYETGPGDYIAFEPEEIAKAVPEADKTLDVEAFVPCDQVDDVYFDRPYYLAPSAPAGAEAFALIRDVMASANVAAVARTVLFRRVRSVLIRAHGEGLIAHTLNFDYEVRSAEEAFSELPDAKADDEMLDLALHIIKKKAGRFDPTTFDDRYDAALVELVKAKMEGRKITPPKPPAATKPSDLMEALRQSAGGDSGARAEKRKAAPRKTAKNRKRLNAGKPPRLLRFYALRMGARRGSCPLFGAPVASVRMSPGPAY